MFRLLFLTLPLLSACASRSTGASYYNACDEMKKEIKEKERVDAKVKSLKKEIAAYRRANDTASASASQRDLDFLLGNQKDLLKSLDQSSQDCKPSFYQSRFPDGKLSE